MPVHGEGSSVWKELEATKDLLMKSQTYGYMYRETLVGSGVVPTEPPERPLTLKMKDATKTPPGAHTHEITLNADEVKEAKGKRKSFVKTTTQGASHQHQISVAWRNNQWKILHCDNYDQGAYRCKDKHGMYLNENLSV